MANPLDLPQNFSTTLNVGGGVNSSQTTGIIATSVTGLPTDGGLLAFDWANPIDTTTIEYIEYTGITGNEFTGVTRGQEGVTAKAHSNGATIVGVVSRAHIKRLRDKLTGNDAVALQDPNGNEILKTAYAASAVNEVTVTNAATTDNPTISATGGDSNIGINIKPKGTGVVAIDGPENYAADAGSNDTYVITIEGITAYATGQKFSFKANTINTGAATLNVNSLGAKTIKKNYNSDLADGDIAANQLVEVIYDGTNFQLLSPVNNTFKGAKVYLSSSVTINNASETLLSWNAEEYDTDSMHDNSTNPSRITINTAGKYQIHSSINFLPAASGRRYSEFYKNGSVLNGGLTQLITTGASGTTTLHGQLTVDLSASDYLEVKVYQDSGGGVDIGGGNSDSRCIFEVYKIG